MFNPPLLRRKGERNHAAFLWTVKCVFMEKLWDDEVLLLQRIWHIYCLAIKKNLINLDMRSLTQAQVPNLPLSWWGMTRMNYMPMFFIYKTRREINSNCSLELFWGADITAVLVQLDTVLNISFSVLTLNTCILLSFTLRIKRQNRNPKCFYK